MIDFTQLNNTFFYDTDKQYVIDVFNTACIVATSFLFSSIFISIYGINDAYDWYDDDDEPDIPYENKYPIDTIDNNIDTEFIPNKSNFICESTPNGTVFMRYDKDNNGFDYWCNDNQIEYKYLETVARKYVIDNKCLNIYVDYKEEYIQGLNKYKHRLQERKKSLENKLKEHELHEDNVESKKKNIFANFKSYNKQDKNTKNITDTNTKEYILTENSNHYKYKGNLDDYEKMLKEKASQESLLKEYEQIDFKAYKTMIKKNH